MPLEHANKPNATTEEKLNNLLVSPNSTLELADQMLISLSLPTVLLYSDTKLWLEISNRSYSAREMLKLLLDKLEELSISLLPEPNKSRALSDSTSSNINSALLLLLKLLPILPMLPMSKTLSTSWFVNSTRTRVVNSTGVFNKLTSKSGPELKLSRSEEVLSKVEPSLLSENCSEERSDYQRKTLRDVVNS